MAVFLGEYQIPAAGVTNAVNTDEFRAPDKFTGQFVVENPNAAGTLNVVPWHSNDGGRTWVAKTALTLSATGTIAANAVSSLFGADDGSTMNMEKVRLQLYTTTTATCNVKVYISGRSY